mgnify:CR=1 FL=1
MKKRCTLNTEKLFLKSKLLSFCRVFLSAHFGEFLGANTIFGGNSGNWGESQEMAYGKGGECTGFDVRLCRMVEVKEL